jgi:cytochrome c2
MSFSKKTTLVVALTVVVVGLLAACGGGGAASGGETPIGDPAKGKTIYETGGASGVPCLTCHTLDGSELVGPSFQGIASRAGTRIEGTSAEDYLRQSITDPKAFVVEGFESTMPETYDDLLSDDDIDNVIAYLLSLTE